MDMKKIIDLMVSGSQEELRQEFSDQLAAEVNKQVYSPGQTEQQDSSDQDDN